MRNRLLASALSSSFLAGKPGLEETVSRGTRTLGKKWPWLRSVAKRYLIVFNGPTRPRHQQVVRFLLRNAVFQRACAKYSKELRVQQWIAEPARMQPAKAALAWSIPAITTTGDLADWLGLTVSELDWFADLKGLGFKRNAIRLQHYHYRVLAKDY